MFRNALRLSPLAIVAVLAACQPAAPDESVDGQGSNITQREFDKNDVLDDKSLRDSAAMSADDVQAFLDETPWGTKSVLASYTEDGKSAAEIMTSAAKKYGLNPLAMLVRVQMEEGLVSKKTAPASTIAIAFGCGCPDSAACSDKYKGFANQAECAAGTLSRSLARATTDQGTVSGWARDKSKESLDGLTVTPTNAATAALYTYTPWVGEAGGGKKGVGGASLHFKVWNQFAGAIGYGAVAGGTTTTTSGSKKTDAGTNDDDAGATDPTTGPTTDDAGADPGTDPSADPPVDDDAGAHPTDPPTTADAGAKGDGHDAGTKAQPPSDGSDDDQVLGEGNAPPTSNAPPPSNPATSKSPDYGRDLPTASEEELAGKPKTKGGCSASGTSGGTNGAVVALAAALSIAAARRRRRSGSGSGSGLGSASE